MPQPNLTPRTIVAPAYCGHEQLVAMRHARNYNAMIEGLLSHWLGDSHFLVDIGAGVGEFAQRMTARGHYVLSVEPDAAQRQVILGQCLHCVDSVSEIDHNRFDAAYSLNVLEHIEDDVGALRQWRTAVRPGGLILLYVPAFPLLYSAMDRAVGHCRRYTRKTLTQVAVDAGWTVLHSGYADSLGFLASLALRARGGDGSLSPATVWFYDRIIFPFSRLFDLLVGRVIGKNVWLVARKEFSPGQNAGGAA
jgi:SAM-dependent methyltransferase